MLCAAVAAIAVAGAAAMASAAFAGGGGAADASDSNSGSDFATKSIDAKVNPKDKDQDFARDTALRDQF